MLQSGKLQGFDIKYLLLNASKLRANTAGYFFLIDMKNMFENFFIMHFKYK